MRQLLVFTFAILALITSAIPVAAQGPTPAATSLLAGLGYSELRITVTDTGVDAPADVTAGRFLVVVDNQSKSYAEASFFQLPNGLTFEQAMATPAPEGDMPPAWYYEAILPGGAGAIPGAEGRAVVDLAAGDWFIDVFRDEEGREAELPSRLKVTGRTGTAVAAPEPDGAVEVTMHDFAFDMPTSLPAGPQIWKVSNTGKQPHLISLNRGPDTLTVDQVMAVYEVMMNGGTPPPGLPNPETDFEDVGGSSVLSAGQTTWMELDLEPGTYAAICWFPDRETGQLHLMMGMTSIFTVR